MSSQYIFILAIIGMVLGYKLLKSWVGERPPAPAPVEEEDADSMLARIETLEARIQVVERIVTDRNHDWKREIDQL